MRAYARQQPLRASCEPRQRASTLRRVRRSERHGMRQRIRAALLATLLAACATTHSTAQPDRFAEAVDCTPEAPCSRTDGVWLPADLAVHLAGAEARWRECRKQLESCESPSGWGTCAACAAAGAALAGGACAAARR